MRTIKPEHIWTKAALAIADALGRNTVREVGGCVRDSLIGRDVQDIDFATVHEPDEVIRLLENASIVVKKTGYDHGTVSAIIDKRAYEITTLRRDVDTDGRHAKVSFSTSWEGDAQRRDFTINALYCDDAGKIYDEIGRSITDIEARIIRFIGEPEKRIKEDYLRVLRVFRFYAQLKDFTIEEASLKACRGHEDGLSQLSIERVTDEFVKLLLAPNTVKSLNAMKSVQIATHFKINENAPAYFDAVKDVVKTNVMLPSLVVLAFGQNYKTHLRLSNAVIKIATLIHTLEPKMSWQETAYRFDRATALNHYLYQNIINARVIELEILRDIDNFPIPKNPITSKAYIEKGLEGKALGDAMRRDEEVWIDKTFKVYENTHE